MPQPGPLLDQILPSRQADALQTVATDAWDGIARMLGAILGAPPALVDTGLRLVMPGEVEDEFGDAHIVLPLRLSAGSSDGSAAWLSVPLSMAAPFFDSRDNDPDTERAQTAAQAATLAGQVVQAINATTLGGAPAGASLVIGEPASPGAPAIPAGFDEACVLLEGLLNAGRALPFRLLLPVPFLEALAMAGSEGSSEAGSAATGASAAAVDLSQPGTFFDLDDAEPAAPPAPSAPPQREPTPIMAAPTAQRAQFAPLPESSNVAMPANIDLLSDLEMSISVELGRTEMSVAEVLALGSGSVIELDRLAGEPVDILVNDRIIARGEVVVVDENFGVRIVEVLPRSREIGKAS